MNISMDFSSGHDAVAVILPLAQSPLYSAQHLLAHSCRASHSQQLSAAIAHAALAQKLCATACLSSCSLEASMIVCRRATAPSSPPCPGSSLVYRRQSLWQHHPHLRRNPKDVSSLNSTQQSSSIQTLSKDSVRAGAASLRHRTEEGGAAWSTECCLAYGARTTLPG